ncbi:hypothetical protein F1559_000339 [Cyanidiococcus yangmingshanensis]|uniref:Uncharacterized protein n=1 Tax=Cyanidiococcus yangmingshanensis TaxID=2690220 RepID=A0A7J7IMD1_9RHOD|nr:hypothetical protein F1559_000339 [Cyanidiococcus yangmingshanensis]
MASLEAFLLPFHWEDVVVDPNLVRQQVSSRSIPARYMVSMDAFDLTDSISVHSAVALACGDAIENVPCSILTPTEPTVSEKEDRTTLLTGSNENEALLWWQATVSDGAATQLRALLWCIHHWRGLNDASMRLQLFRCVQKGLMLALAAMHRAARVERDLVSCSERAAESWRSTIRLVAFVAAHWLQAAEQDLSEEAAEANMPLSSAWWSARHPGVQRPPLATGKQRRQLETPSRARSRRVTHRAKTSRTVEDSDQSDRESSEDQCEAPETTSRAISGASALSNSDPWAAVYEAEREDLLDAFGQLLRDERLLCLAFSGSHPEDAYLYLFVRTACALLESRSVCRQERARALLVELITDCLSRYGQGNRLCPILVHGLQRHEHVAAVLVDIIQALGSDAHKRQPCGLDDPTNDDEVSDHRSEVLPAVMPLSASNDGRCGCIRDLITQVAQIPLTELARDHVCARNVARFLTEFADRVPSCLIPYLPLWIPHLDGEAYLVRNALVHAFGQVIQYITGTAQEGACASTPAQDESKALQERLIQLLLKRLEDVHSLARSRTLQVWHRLVQARCVPVALYPTLESHIVSRLQDKSLHVRRAALQLFTTCIRLNPFAAHLEQGLFTLRQEQCLQTQNDVPRAILVVDARYCTGRCIVLRSCGNLCTICPRGDPSHLQSVSLATSQRRARGYQCAVYGLPVSGASGVGGRTEDRFCVLDCRERPVFAMLRSNPFIPCTWSCHWNVCCALRNMQPMQKRLHKRCRHRACSPLRKRSSHSSLMPVSGN